MRSTTKLFITLLSPLVGLLLAEAVLRWTSLQPAPRPEVRGVLFRPSLVPGLTFENRPGARRTIAYRETPDADPRVVEHCINAQGFRGSTVAQREPNSLRIACIGDSHTFGAGVSESEAWPAALQRELSRSDPRLGIGLGPVEVLNWGVNAYDTRREVLLLRERVLDFQPDLVLLQYHVNDVSARNAFGWKPEFDDPLWKFSAPDRGGWIGSLRRASRLVDVALDRLHAVRGARDESGLDMSGYAPDAEGWRAVCAALREARDELGQREIPFGVVLFPTLLEHGEHLSSHAAFRQVQRFCEAEDIAVLDVEPALLRAAAGRAIEELRVHPHDAHAGAEAHAVFGHAVAEWLAREPSLLQRTAAPAAGS